MTERKPRGDSVLKTLPAARQAEIAEYCEANNLVDAVAWLRDHGIETSRTALSDYLSWYRLRQRLERNQSTVQTLLDSLEKEAPQIPPEKLFEHGQRLFAGLAIESQDPDIWLGTQRLHLQQQQLDLERQKFRRETAELFLTWSEDQRAKQILSSAESNSSKIERLGSLMFGEDWK